VKQKQRRNKKDEDIDMRKYNCKGYEITANSKEEAIAKMNEIWESEAYGMSNLFQNKTGLDVPIYVDDEMTYKLGGHGKRIKFKASLTSENNSRNFATMKLDGEIVEGTMPKKLSDTVSEKVIKGVKNFVLNNWYALDKLADKLIDIADFLSVMLKGTKKATVSQIKKQKEDVDRLIEENKKNL
jgi:hypothetical protein